MIHQAAEPDREAGGEYQVDAADHAGDKYRARFQERPEHQCEQDREIDHVLHQIISENQMEGIYPEHRVPILRTEPRRKRLIFNRHTTAIFPTTKIANPSVRKKTQQK